jgi:hypothetical protein
MSLTENLGSGRASCTITHRRAYDFDEKTGLWRFKLVDDPETVWNLITNAGRDFLHSQGYNTSGLGSNGLNYIALSNDTVGEGAGSTILSNEITTNGLARTQGTYAHTPGNNVTTIDHTFTASGTQSAQKAALFTASSSGTMNHVLGFTQRNLITSDTLQVTFQITLG